MDFRGANIIHNHFPYFHISWITLRIRINGYIWMINEACKKGKTEKLAKNIMNLTHWSFCKCFPRINAPMGSPVSSRWLLSLSWWLCSGHNWLFLLGLEAKVEGDGAKWSREENQSFPWLTGHSPSQAEAFLDSNASWRKFLSHFILKKFRNHLNIDSNIFVATNAFLHSNLKLDICCISG